MATRSASKCCVSGVTISPDQSFLVKGAGGATRIMSAELCKAFMLHTASRMLPDGTYLDDDQVADFVATVGPVPEPAAQPEAQAPLAPEALRALQLDFLEHQLGYIAAKCTSETAKPVELLSYVKAVTSMYTKLDVKRSMDFLLDLLAYSQMVEAEDAYENDAHYVHVENLKSFSSSAVAALFNTDKARALSDIDEHKPFHGAMSALNDAFLQYTMTGLSARAIALLTR